jgi:hypothetical protein
MTPHKDGWSWSEIGLTDWRRVVDLRLEEVYAITIEDAGFDDELMKSHWEEKSHHLSLYDGLAKSTIWSQESQFGYIQIK